MSLPNYPEYKDSGVEWLGEVPNHWNVKRLRFVVQLNPSKGEVASLEPSTEVSFLPMEAIGENGSLDLERTRVLGEVGSGYTYFREGDVAIAKITPCFENGKGAIMRGLLGGIGFGTTELIVARPNIDQTCSDYIHWLFTSVPFRCLGEAAMYGAGGQKRVPDDFVRNFSIALPCTQEQSAIAAFLDRETAKIDALVAEQEKLIELLKEKRQAVISHAVTKGLDPNVPMKDCGLEWLGEVPEHWTVKRLKQVGKLIGGAGFPHEFQGQESEVLPFYKVGDIGRSPDDRTMKGSENTVSLETAESLRAKIIPEGSIVYAKIGAAMLLNRRRITEIQCCIDNNMTAFIPNRSLITTEWAFYWLCILDFGELANPGAVPSFSEGDQANLIILQPPVQEQIEIAKLINGTNHKMSSLICEAQRAIDLLKERRAALISAAVTGKIDVRGLADATQ